MTRRIIPYCFLLLISPASALSQEVVTGLQSNPLLEQGSGKRINVKGMSSDTLELPFFDDFSREDIYPKPEKWSDDFVFINNTYSLDQITSGVATFDALDNNGRLYETASYIAFEADHLTSLPIDLGSLPSDSLRLSFFYQPGGLADMPEENDSLILQFYAPAEEKWYPVWKATGAGVSGFRFVILRIDNPRFLQNGFRFRFINYASLSANLTEPSMIGNCDHWNIDYILLDRNRKDSDTVFHDVGFRYPHRSLLKNHESMPLNQFLMVSLNEMGTSIPVHYRNNDMIVRNVTRNFEIWDVYENTLVKSIFAGAVNIDPLTNTDTDIDLIYTFGTNNNDSALFRITSWLITDSFDPKQNDTVVYYQKFSNYFAFDDGSSEAGYGINGLGSRYAMVAYRFTSFIEDTLRAIRICFNDSYLNANQRSFDLMVWDDLGGIPGNVIYTQEEAMVQQGESVNGFYTYRLREGIGVEGNFYVGWKQRSETFLNAGLDVNTPHKGRQFYSISGTWIQSAVQGSLMIRPVTGPPIATSINDITWKDKKVLHFYPNPARDFITFDEEAISVYGLTYITVIDLQGREVLRAPLSRMVDISSLHEGMYLIVANLNGRSYGYNRLIKTR